nr:hypothetical protein [Mycobacterium genavense]
MIEPTDARPEIDPTFKALLDLFPQGFDADAGVAPARERLKVPPELLPDLRIEDRTVCHGDLVDIPVRIYWPPTPAEISQPTAATSPR